MQITLDKEEIQKLAQIREELKKAKLNSVYRGVYKNTILDWQPDEENDYPRGTNIYIKDGNNWKPYTGVFFREEYILTDHDKVTPWEYEVFLKGQPAEKVTVYDIYYKGTLQSSKVVVEEV